MEDIVLKNQINSLIKTYGLNNAISYCERKIHNSKDKNTINKYVKIYKSLIDIKNEKAETQIKKTSFTILTEKDDLIPISLDPFNILPKN